MFDMGLTAYEKYKEMLKSNNTVSYSKMNIMVCDELYAVILARTHYNDKKVFSPASGYYRPVGMAVTTNNLRPLFLGLMHVEGGSCNNSISVPENNNEKMLIPGIDVITFTEALSSFVGNSLNVSRPYKTKYFDFYVLMRSSEYCLAIDYKCGYRKSYFNKFKCREVSHKIKQLMSSCEIDLTANDVEI